MRIKRGEEKFEETLDMLLKRHTRAKAGPDAEVIVNWNKREAKEDDVVSFYATNHELANAIKRGRKNIMEVDVSSDGATLLFKTKGIRALYTVVRPS